MGKVTITTVWTGNDQYKISDVKKIRNMVLRNCGVDWEPHFVCYTDQPDVPHGWRKVDLTIYPYEMRHGWWGKMQVFDPLSRGPYPTVYFDLDTVIVGDITPLFEFAANNYFGICENFTKQVVPSYACKFGSCVMTFHPDFGASEFYVWSKIYEHSKRRAGRFGDQWVIQELIPDAMTLQGHLPRGFFVGRRDFKETLEPSNAVMIFAGKRKPSNSLLPWVKEHWK